MPANNAINLNSAGIPAFNATTGVFTASTTTPHSVLIGDSNNLIKNLGLATDGQIPIGSTGSDPVLAGLTAGANITITPGAGSITIAASTGTAFTMTDVISSTQAMTANAGYTANNASSITFTLPATAAYGSVLAIIGINTGGYTIAQNAGQSILMGNQTSTPGVTGVVSALGAHNVIFLICVAANTKWAVTGSIGSFDVA